MEKHPEVELVFRWIGKLEQGNRAEFGRKSNITSNTIYRWARDNSPPGKEALAKIRNAYNLTPEEYESGPDAYNDVKAFPEFLQRRIQECAKRYRMAETEIIYIAVNNFADFNSLIQEKLIARHYLILGKHLDPDLSRSAESVLSQELNSVDESEEKKSE